MKRLNDQQREAAGFVSGVAAVVAVPGAGKTLAMTCRIASLVEQHGVSPESVLGLAFTRNAAKAMRVRLAEVLGSRANRVTLATIHSFCNTLLKQEGRTFEILNGIEQLRFLRRVLEKVGAKNLPVGVALREISLAKSNLVTSAEFAALYEGDETMRIVAEVFAEYDRQKRHSGLLDFDDLLCETHGLLLNATVSEKYRSLYRHILVDEFQDTNPAQMEILKLLAGKSKESSFWICGDDWQSIYSFTGASVGNILNFNRVYPEARMFVLNQNYRSTPQILKACQNLIGHNIRKIEKTLETANPPGEDVFVLTAASEEGEAAAVANEIRDLDVPTKDIAILYRANFQSRAVEEALAQAKIPYRVENGHGFFQRREVKTLLDYLRLINAPDSEEGDEALRQIINVPNRYLGRKFITDLEIHAAERKTRLYEALKTVRPSPPYIRRHVAKFLDIVDPLMGPFGREPAETLSMLREALDYDRFVAEDDIPSPDDSKVANVNQLSVVAGKFRDIASLLAHADAFQDERANDPEGVSLMTIHKSKGLEFPVVFVIGMVDGVLPSRQGDIEEERRIAFVGMSRAMRLLFLSHSQHVSGRAVKPSPFLREARGLTSGS
jgi:DNA helicase-2/ATP-dependent DNA helicase PcrA